ncbi:MAG: Ig-like domain-containing protein [Gemmatimonadaceae bacterium]
MHSSRAWRPSVLAVAFAFAAAACGSDGPSKGGNNSTVAAISFSTGNNQVGVPGTALATPISARVTNAQGNPVAGKPVDFTVTRGGGSVAALTVTTDNSGIAQTTWTLGSGAVRQNVKASVGTVQGLATATVDTTRSLFLMAAKDTVSVGDTIWVDFYSGTTALGETRGAVQETVVNSIPLAAHLAAIIYTRGELIDDSGTNAQLTVVTSGPTNAQARQKYMRFGYVASSSGKDVQFNHTAAAFVAARTFNDLLSRASVVGTTVHIR